MLDTHQNSKISVICNCYNGQDYLRYAIDSVLNQTYDNFELLFIDNCSTDNTKKIINSYLDSRIKYFQTEVNVNLGEARNFALKYITGEFFAFIDADDIWVKDKLEKQINFMLFQNINICYSQAKIFYLDGRENEYSYRNKDQLIDIHNVSKNYDICFSTLIAKTSLLENMKNIFNPSLKVTEDADFIFKIARNSLIGYFSDFTAYYRSSNNSLTWKEPYSFITDLNLMKKDYSKGVLNPLLLDPLYDTAYWINVISNWKDGSKKLSFNYLFKIKKWKLRHYLCLIMLNLPYKLLKPFFVILGKKIN